MTNPVKNLTQWLPPNRLGTIKNLGYCFIVDNSGNFIVDNLGNFLVTTPYNLTGPFATKWSPTPAS